MARRFRVASARLEAAVVAQNAFNRRYTDFRHDNVADRRLYATLSIDY
jgi:hypothetical protein